MSANAFTPQGDTQPFAVTATSTPSPVQVKGGNNNATQRMIYNVGSGKDCFLVAAKTAAAAVAVAPTGTTPHNGTPIPAGAIMILSYPPDAYFAAICAGSDTTTLYITPGEGV